MPKNPFRDELISSFLGQVDRWVRGFISRYPDLSLHFDDLIGEAHLRLVTVVDKKFRKFQTEFDGNIDKFSVYVRLSIYSALTDFVRGLGMVRFPRRWRESRCDQLREDDRVVDWRVDNPPDPDDSYLIDSLEDCLAPRAHKKDRAILRARLEGAETVKEISEKTGIPVRVVYRRIAAIQARYKAREDERAASNDPELSK